MASQAEIDKYLAKILESEEFASSKIYKSYLSYLVKANQEGKNLKEATIAIEFFGKDAHFNPSEDTIVRTHTFALRKKLESYYYHEGREDKMRLVLPKGGHYEVVLMPIADTLSPSHQFKSFIKKNVHYLTILSLLALIASMAIYNCHLKQELSDYRIIDLNDPIWRDYLQSSLPILIVAGDHFFYEQRRPEFEDILTIRNPKINSMEEFQAMALNNTYRAANEPYFPYHSIWSLPPILSILYSAKEEPILRKSSSISPQILNEYNIIFVGSIKTLYILKHTLMESHFDFTISPHSVIYTPKDTSATQIFSTTLHSSGPNDDLVLVVKVPGPKKNSIFIIASFHSLGAPEIARYLTHPVLRTRLDHTFSEKLGYIPDYFELLFRVSGIDKTAYSTELLICEEIPTK